jgi:hypothetical protein
LGSGVSGDLGIPKWKDLIDQLEAKLSYPKGKSPESYRAEQLFQFYSRKLIAELGWTDRNKMEAAINVGWRSVVSGTLYKNFPKGGGGLNVKSYQEKIDAHPYLSELARLAASLQLVVSHNFDDALECAIDLDKTVTASPGMRTQWENIVWGIIPMSECSLRGD